MSPLARSAERDDAIRLALPQIPRHGWTWRAVEASQPNAQGQRIARELFPGGGPEMVETFCDLADRHMLQAAAALPPNVRGSARLRATLALRLAQAWDDKDAIRRAVSLMLLPAHTTLAARCTYRTVDALWTAAADKSVDFSWYSKRASLGLVYTATFFFWLRDDDPAAERSLAFYDRRVAGLRALGRWRAALGGRR